MMGVYVRRGQQSIVGAAVTAYGTTTTVYGGDRSGLRYRLDHGERDATEIGGRPFMPGNESDDSRPPFGGHCGDLLNGCVQARGLRMNGDLAGIACTLNDSHT